MQKRFKMAFKAFFWAGTANRAYRGAKTAQTRLSSIFSGILVSVVTPFFVSGHEKRESQV